MNPRPESARESRLRNRRRFTLFTKQLDSPNLIPLEGGWPSNRPSTVSASNISSPLPSPFAYEGNRKRTCEEKEAHQLNQTKRKRRTSENISECEEATGRDHYSGYKESSLVDRVSSLTTHYSFNDRPSPVFLQRPSAKGALVRPESDDIEEGEVVEEDDEEDDARMLARMKDSTCTEQKPERKCSVIVSNLEPGTTPEDVAVSRTST